MCLPEMGSLIRMAMRIWSRVLSQFACTCALLAAFAIPPAHAATEWREASTDHFIIYADAPDHWLRSFAERLEKFDSGLRYLRNMETLSPGHSNRLVIFVVANGTAVRKLCGANCNNVYGFYVPRVGGSIAVAPRDIFGASSRDFTPEVVLLHEYTHHFLLANSRGAHPRWLNEGFAEFNSTAEAAKDGSLCFGRAAQHRAYGLLSGDKLRLETVLDPGTRKLGAQEQDRFYGRSWLLLHYLTFEETRRGQLATYVEAFNNGKTSLEAARTAFGNLAKLDRELDSYLDRRVLLCRKVSAENLTAGTMAIRPLTAGEAAMLPLRMRSDRGVDELQAAALVPEGRNAAKAFPNDAGAQVVLAGIEYDAGNLDEAEVAADRALAADPKAFRALLYKGRIAVQRIENAQSNDAQAWNEARTWFVKANALDHDDAAALYGFFMTFVQQGLQPNDNAAAALRRAFKLSPQDYELRWTYASYLLNSGETAEARLVLMPLAHDPHQNGDNRALAIVRAIDAGATGQKAMEAIATSESRIQAQPRPQ